MQHLIFTKHAIARKQQRKISTANIYETYKNPNAIRRAKRHCVKYIGKNTTIVVDPSKNIPIVITTYPTKKKTPA